MLTEITAEQPGLGASSIGMLESLTTLVPALLAFPYASAAKRYGPSGVMSFGALCFFLVGFALFFFSNQQLASWGLIITYYCLYGAARGVWENTNKAAVADIFEFHPEIDSAFAAIYFTSAVTGSAGYYILPYLSRAAMAYIITTSSVIAIASYLWAVRYHRTHHLVSTTEEG